MQVGVFTFRKLVAVIAVAVIIVSIAPVPQTRFARGDASAATRDDGFFRTDLYTDAGGGAIADLNWSNFAEGDYLGQDLYAMLLNSVRHEAEDVTITRTMEKRGLSREEVLAFIDQADITEILNKPDVAPAVSLGDLAAFKEEIDEERFVAELKAEMNSEVKSKEIFTNGNTDDSGFDLLVDLDIIYQILFAQSITQGGASPESSGGPASGLLGILEREDEDEADNTGGGATDADTDADADEGADGEGADDAPVADEEEMPEPLAIPFSPAVCAADPALNQAFWVDDALHAQDEQAGGAVGDGSAATDPTGTGAASEDEDEEDGSPSDGGDEGTAADERFTRPAPDRTREPFCTPEDVICFTFEAKMKTASSYSVSDNCVQCHIQKINELFNKTLSKNLVPSKVAGNLLEMPKCKDQLSESLASIDMDIFAISQPIVTPPNDDIVVESDYSKNFDDFYESYFGDQNRGLGGARTEAEDDAAKKVLSISLPGASPQTKSVREVEKYAAAERDRKLQEVRNLTVGERAGAKATHFQVITTEMNQMNAYFKSMRAIFKSIEKPCEELLNDKPVCD